MWSLLGEDSPAAAQAKAQKQREAEEGVEDDSDDDYDDYDEGQAGPAGQFIEEEGARSQMAGVVRGKGGRPLTNGRMDGGGADGGANVNGRDLKEDRDLILELRQQPQEQGQLLRQLCSRLGPPEP